MSDLRYIRLRGATGAVRTASFAGQDRLVVPVIALVEGVVHPLGAEGPELVLASELELVAEAWNNRPVMDDHPMDGKVPVTANTPGRLEAASYGEIFNARMEGTKLVMEEWLNPSRAAAIGGEASKTIQRIQAGQTTEVSVGVGVALERKAGVYNGKPYVGIWRRIRPDHLANLPEGVKGACSVAMGCGTLRSARITAEGYEEEEIMADAIPKRTLRQRMGDLFRSAIKGWNQTDVRDAVRTALKQAEPLYDYIEDIWESDNYVVYCVYSAVPGGTLTYAPGSHYPLEPYTTKTYRRDFSITKEGVVTLGERVEVEFEGKFVPVMTAAADGTVPPCSCGAHRAAADALLAAAVRNAASTIPTTSEADMKTKAERVTALMGNVHNPLKDQKALETAEETALVALEAHCANAETLKAAADRIEADRVAAEKATKDAADAAARAAAATTATTAAITPEAFYAANPDVKMMVDGFKAAQTAQKATLIGQMKAAGQKAFTEAELAEKSIDELTKLVALAGVSAPVNYAGLHAADGTAAAQDYAPPDSYGLALKAKSQATH